MSNTTNKPAAADKLREALVANPGSTAAELATISGLGRSTVDKQLAALKQAGDAAPTEDDSGNRGRTSSRWTMTGRAEPVHLRPGQLAPLVLDYVATLDAPVGPSAVAKALGRSAGAVANCMARLADSGRLKQTSKKPRRYKRA